MDYTKNYHLPQWVMSDRIMMEDFNQMCADIDAGLSGVRAEAQGSSAVLTSQIGQMGRDVTRVENSLSALAAKEAVQSALFRLAYNQYDRFLALQERPRQVGVFHQSFAQSENAAAAGFTQLKNGVWLMKNTTAMTLEDIRPSLRQLTSLSSSSDTVTLTFTTTAAGMLTQVRLTGQFYGGSAESFNSGKMFLRLWNTGTGELEQSDTVILNGLNGDNAAGTFFIDKMDLPLHGGQSYRLELQLETLNFHPAIGANVNGNCMSISGALSAAPTASPTGSRNRLPAAAD